MAPTTVAPQTVNFNTLVADVFGVDLPPTEGRSLFRDTVRQVADRALAAMDPALAGRIAKAMTLVLQGDVTLLPGGAAQVASHTDGVTTYHVNGLCTCHDASRAPLGYCKQVRFVHPKLAA